MANSLFLPRPRWPIYAGAALVLAALLLGVVVPGAMAGWLGAAVLFTAIPAGSLYLVMMMRLIPGAWGEELRLSAEAATLLTPWGAVAFVPVMLGIAAIYPWMHGTELTAMQKVVLSPLFFVALTVGRFAALLWLGGRMRRRVAPTATAALGLVALPLFATVVAFVWLLSLDPKVSSSAFGLQFLVREFTVALTALLLLRLSAGAPPRRLWVAGGVLLTLLLVWAYIEFLSFFINWSTNLPEGAHWYLLRGQGGWGALLWAWGALSTVSLIALLFGRVRGDPRLLRGICIAVLAGKVCEMAWVTLPGFGVAGIAGYVVSLAGLGLVAFGALPDALHQRVRAREPKGIGR